DRMQSSLPTTQFNVQENVYNPSQPSNLLPPEYQPSLGSIILNPVLNPIQNGQQPFIISGILTNSQLVQGNTHTVYPITGTETRSFNTEAKTLAAIQIIIGLFHVCLGIVLALMCTVYNGVLGFASLAILTGYPFWGGLCFIITGALTVSAVKRATPCMIKGSLGMNIVSAIFVFFGVIFLLIDEGINGVYNQNIWAVLSGRGIAAILAIFSVVEFVINCITANLASQAMRTSQ
ncbi:Membrane-spanning 4-domains subfamily A member 12, partial [Galemys pyrenaicus]